MEFEIKDYPRNISEPEIVADIIAACKKNGKGTLTMNEYAMLGKYHSSTIRKNFGSWNAALKKAGITPLRPMMKFDAITEEELLKNLEDVWLTLAGQPTMSDMRRKSISRYRGDVYARFFGSWMKGLKMFAEYKKHESYWANRIRLVPATEKAVQQQKTGECKRDTRSISVGLRLSVLLRDGFRCTACGKSPLTHLGVKLHCDHVRPWSKGGRTIIENLKTLCAECNYGKGNMELTENHPPA